MSNGPQAQQDNGHGTRPAGDAPSSNGKAPRKMDSRELGLVLAQQLCDMQDLHYGLWEPDIPVTLTNVPVAQQRYTDNLLGALAAAAPAPARVLDIGCGSGHVMVQLLERGYRVDGVIPSAALADMVRGRVGRRVGQGEGCDTRVFECRFEDLSVAEAGTYDVALFSESFQYMVMDEAFAQLERLVVPGGHVVICDFFRSEHDGDGGFGDRSFRGGKKWTDFQELLADSSFDVVRDDDITRLVSPSLELMHDLLTNRVGPAGATLGRYMRDNHPVASWLGSRLFRGKWKKLRFKYFSGRRSREVFERYKTYHLLVLRRRA